MITNDIVKFKYRGMKTKFRVMGYDEKILPNSVQTLVHTDVHDDPDVQYAAVLEICGSRPIIDWPWMPTVCQDEFITESHTCRVYLEQLTNL